VASRRRDEVRRFARRLAGARGESTVQLAGDAIRGVALGVGVTAVVQSVLGGIGLLGGRHPVRRLAVGALMFMLCIAQVGPALVLLPAVAWVFWDGSPVWGTVLLVWTVLVTSLDNVLRPALIRMGADLPLLLIFSGVIGGLLAFGLVGIFVGPVVLAVGYTLLEHWMAETDPPAAAGTAASTAPPPPTTGDTAAALEVQASGAPGPLSGRHAPTHDTAADTAAGASADTAAEGPRADASGARPAA
jgi:predicted PurR-regulated permease PerM